MIKTISRLGICNSLFKFLLTCSLLLNLTTSHAQITDLIPKPEILRLDDGFLNISDINYISISSNDLRPQAKLLAEGLSILEIPIIVEKKPKKSGVKIRLDISPLLANEDNQRYQLQISPKEILINAHSEASLISGVFRVLQLQLLQINRSKLPALALSDTPRFEYRGLHLDVSRHFYPVQFLEKLLDMMALYQLNTFHWHLTDGPGWRLEIKSYPLLTEKAAFRTHRNWKDWWNSPRKYLNEGNPSSYGGYYTKEEASHIVQYAAQRGITVIPEIEMPGHSEEVLAVYPEFSCTGVPYTQSELCMGKEEVFAFLENVLTEVMEIFPSEYIHIGGDEASKAAWKKCVYCQARIQKEGLADEDALQSYGIKRISHFLAKHGRKLMGWDEILEGGLAPGATVMSWRGEEGGIAAAKAGHEVIMTPGAYCYFDSYQTDPTSQPEAIGGYLPIEKVYRYDPIPAILSTEEALLVKGVQANVWTEYMPTQEHVEYMIFPRLLALSETAWTTDKNWEDFHQRLQSHYRLLQRKGINYYRPIPNLEIKATVDTTHKASIVHIHSEHFRPLIRYTLDGSDPQATSDTYTGPFIQEGTPTVKAALLLDTGEMGPISSNQLAYHQGVNAQVIYHKPFSKSYPAHGENTLVNGQRGSFTYGDGEWQGFEGRDMDITIELDQVKMISSVLIHFMQLTGPGVYLPANVSISWATDGDNFNEPTILTHDISDSDSRLIIHPFELKIGEKIQKIRIKATNKHKGFLFADEVMLLK